VGGGGRTRRQRAADKAFTSPSLVAVAVAVYDYDHDHDHDHVM
jgi:hypothetical protein